MAGTVPVYLLQQVCCKHYGATAGGLFYNENYSRLIFSRIVINSIPPPPHGEIQLTNRQELKSCLPVDGNKKYQLKPTGTGTLYYITHKKTVFNNATP